MVTEVSLLLLLILLLLSLLLGKEVSSYCSAHLSDFIKDNKKYQEGDIAGGLCEAFMDIDKELLTDEAVKEMKTVTQQMEEEEEETE